MTDDTEEMETRYQRAEKLLLGLKTTSVVYNDTVLPTWIGESDCFWYKRFYKVEPTSDRIGFEYRLVDANHSTNEIAFDHALFASALSEISGEKVDATALPISFVSLTLSPLTVCFTAFEQRWIFRADEGGCQQLDKPFVQNFEALSPDGRSIAFPRDDNLWLRDLATGEERALTDNGEPDYAYGRGSSAWGRELPELPAQWSPDSKRLLTVKRDKRLVNTVPHVSHVPLDGSIRPQLEEYKVAYPGDEHVEAFSVFSIDVGAGKLCAAERPPTPVSYDGEVSVYMRDLVWWAADSRHAYFIDRERGDHVVRLVEFDTETGSTRVLIEETADSYVNTSLDCVNLPLYRHLPGSNEMIWWSERSGWGHLYLYDLASGELVRPLTSGDWVVRDILHIDEQRREMFVQTSGRVDGRDPYYRDICRLNMDTGEITTLLSSDDEYVVHYFKTACVLLGKFAGETSEHTNGVSPSGNYFVVTRTRADKTPVSLLFDRTGDALMELEVADVSALPDGWRWPEPVKLLAADNQTDIYGLVFRPSNFSPDKSYPVINFINSGPWLSVVTKGSFHTSRSYADRHYFQAASLAELGFIVLILDSRGGPLRSKAFQDESYGWQAAGANTEDHAFAIQQLAERYSYVDIDRVGMCSNGYMSGLQNFLERQDLYKVGVQMLLIDPRMKIGPVGERYQGVEGPGSDKQYPEDLVENMTGQLLLMSVMNSFITAMYPPACVFRIVDALQKFNKDFDMLLIPNAEFGPNNYMYRRSWDYLVKHLLGVEPPKEFMLGEVTWLGKTGNLLRDTEQGDD